jgi:hypothetical protein
MLRPQGVSDLEVTTSCDVRLGTYLREQGKSLVLVNDGAIAATAEELATLPIASGRIHFHLSHPEDSDNKFEFDVLNEFMIKHGYAKKDDDGSVFVNINLNLEATGPEQLQTTSVHEIRHAVEMLETPDSETEAIFENEAKSARKKVALFSGIAGLAVASSLELAELYSQGLSTKDIATAALGGIILAVVGYRWAAGDIVSMRQHELQTNLRNHSEALANDAEKYAADLPVIISIVS